MTPDKKALNRWAHQAGYNDFDTYIQTGGSILEARQDIRIRISWLAKALNDLDTTSPLKPSRGQDQLPVAEAPILEHDKAEMPQAEAPDPANAHIQGAEQ